MFRILLPLSVLLFFTGCLNPPKPAEYPKLSAYKSIQAGCQPNPPALLQAECTQFIDDLAEENRLLNEMSAIKAEEQQEAEYIALADKESAQLQALQTDRTSLALKCQTAMPTIIKNDDIESAAFCLLFEQNAITLGQYQYLKKYAPRFDQNPQYKAYEAQYAKKMLRQGFKAMNLGDKRAALNAFKAASQAKSAEATYFVGIIYEEKQIKKAIAWHKQALSEGVELSRINLARLYLRIKLPEKARAYYLSAAKQGNALAQYRLFKMDAKSPSAKVREEALEWLGRSAENNYPQAQYIYGLQLMKEKRNDEAQQWLEKATANGVSDAGLFLGTLYFEKEAYAKAYTMLVPEKSSGAANYMLAQMYDRGLGVDPNAILAYRYYKRAHDLAYGNYVADMQRLQKSMTKKARKAAQYIDKKESSSAKERIKSCGNPATSKNVKVPKRSVHLKGIAFTVVPHGDAAVVYGENEQIYYVMDTALASKADTYQPIDIKAKAIGTAIVISSDAGTLQKIYQFHTQQPCSNSKGK